MKKLVSFRCSSRSLGHQMMPLVTISTEPLKVAFSVISAIAVSMMSLYHFRMFAIAAFFADPWSATLKLNAHTLTASSDAVLRSTIIAVLNFVFKRKYCFYLRSAQRACNVHRLLQLPSAMTFTGAKVSFQSCVCFYSKLQSALSTVNYKRLNPFCVGNSRLPKFSSAVFAATFRTRSAPPPKFAFAPRAYDKWASTNFWFWTVDRVEAQVFNLFSTFERAELLPWISSAKRGGTTCAS